MFEIPQELIDYWARKNKPKAADVEIEALEAYVGESLPATYTTFLRDYGYVVFSMDLPDSFDAVFDEGGQTVVRRGSIAFVRPAQKVVDAHKRLTRNDPENGLPLFPADYLPVGGDVGQGQILLELRPSKGRVWYWPERDEPWGEVGNTALGYVAADFETFINGLKSEDAP